MDNDVIDAEALVTQYSVEELNATAEAYFARIPDWNHLLAKPFGSPVEAPTIASHFAAMLSVLRLQPGMHLLDFGAGACWTSRNYTQLGCHVTACDVSPTALDIGRHLYQLYPPIGRQPQPAFLLFDGHHIDVADHSFDRVTVMDAFHHIPNRAEVLNEFHRVLRPGGFVVMAEGGPEHSRTAQAQAEMSQYTVVERDIIVSEFAKEAELAGFVETQVGIYAGAPFLVAAQEFEHALATDVTAAEAARHFLANHRLLVLRRGSKPSTTSPHAAPLHAHIDVDATGMRTFTITVTNDGTSTWLSQAQPIGRVNLGVHLFDADLRLVDLDFHRAPLSEDAGAVVEPGQAVVVAVTLPEVLPGRCMLEFDLVAEGVSWFGLTGSPTVKIWIDA